MDKIFSKSEAFRFGWKITKENFWFFFLLLIVINFGYYFLEIVRATLKEERLLILAAIIFIITLILAIILQMGFIKICLKFYDQEKPRFFDLFSQYPLFFKMFLGLILYKLIVIFVMILLIIPGIVFAIKFYFFDYLIVDKGLGPIEALKKSWQITRGSGWNLFAFLFLVGVILLLLIVLGVFLYIVWFLAGFLASLIGCLVAIPTIIGATVFVYRKLLAQNEKVRV